MSEQNVETPPEGVTPAAAGTGEPQPEVKKAAPMVVIKRAGGPVETKRVVPQPVKPHDKGEAQVSAEPTPAEPRPPRAPPGPSVADDVHEGETFADMFERTKGDMPGRKLPKVGEKVRARIFQLGAEMAFVTIGKHEAMIELDELKDDEGVLRSGVGDEVDAFVVETGAKGVVLSRRMSRSAASLSMLAEARASGLPVEGLVIGVNKGGLEVAVGEVRAFCPLSQVDVRPTPKADELVGQRLLFRVTEVRERNVVLSRRSVLEEELKEKAEALRKTLEVGKVVRGRVVSVQAFGAFVDLGGLEGLVPVSELSHVRIGHPSEVVKVGDEVELQLLRLEPAEPHSPDKSRRKERITLSLRARLEDPFQAAARELSEGAIVKGKVVRLQPFGAFVELQPGVDGLIHISAMSERRIAHPRDVLKVGEAVEVKVEKVDPADKRIGLRLVKDGVPVGEGVAVSAAPVAEAAPVHAPQEKKPAPPRPRRGQIVTGKVVRVEPFGVFLEWGEGQSGLIPAAETGTDRGTDLKRVFAMGKEVKAEIIEQDGQKLKLSITAAQKSEERADLEAWKATQPKGAGSGNKGFGTLADKFKGLKL